MSAEEAFMEGAWYSFIAWAWGFPQMRVEFERDTGKKLLPKARSGIEQVVDRVSGAPVKSYSSFTTTSASSSATLDAPSAGSPRALAAAGETAPERGRDSWVTG